jgi:hypothetical protein
MGVVKFDLRLRGGLHISSEDSYHNCFWYEVAWLGLCKAKRQLFMKTRASKWVNFLIF